MPAVRDPIARLSLVEINQQLTALNVKPIKKSRKATMLRLRLAAARTRKREGA